MQQLVLSYCAGSFGRQLIVTVNGKSYTNALLFHGKFRLVSIYHPFKTVYAKRLNGKLIRFN